MNTLRLDKVTISLHPGQSDKLTSSGQSEKLTSSGRSDELTSSGQSDKLTSSGQSDKLTLSRQSDKLTSSGQSDKLTLSGQSDKLNSSGQSDKLILSGQSEKLTSSRQSDKLTSSGQSDKLNSSRQSDCTHPDTSNEFWTNSSRLYLWSNVQQTSGHSLTLPVSVGLVPLEDISGAMFSRHQSRDVLISSGKVMEVIYYGVSNGLHSRGNDRIHLIQKKS